MSAWVLEVASCGVMIVVQSSCDFYISAWVLEVASCGVMIVVQSSCDCLYDICLDHSRIQLCPC